jgi:hypothetical protein
MPSPHGTVFLVLVSIKAKLHMFCQVIVDTIVGIK